MSSSLGTDGSDLYSPIQSCRPPVSTSPVARHCTGPCEPSTRKGIEAGECVILMYLYSMLLLAVDGGNTFYV